MSDIENKQDINDAMDEMAEVPLLKPKRKMKKFERTEKQQEAFKVAMQKRADNIAKRKEQKKIEAAKLLLSVEPESLPSKPSNEVIEKKKPKKQLVLSTSDTESEDETDNESVESEEKIYIARKSIKKPKKVYIIKKEVEEDENHRYPLEKQVNKFKSQQNKKSVVKISNNNNIIPIKNYFCD